MQSTNPLDGLLERTRQRVQVLTGEIERANAKIQQARELISATEAIIGPQAEEKLKLEIFIETLGQTRTMADEIATILPAVSTTNTPPAVRTTTDGNRHRIGVTRIFRSAIIRRLVACGKYRFTAADAIEMFEQEGHSVGKQAVYNALYALSNEENAPLTKDPNERGLYVVGPLTLNGAA